MAKQDDDRARRLAAALRENLKRRKAQARELDTKGGKVQAREIAEESFRQTLGPMNTESKT